MPLVAPASKTVRNKNAIIVGMCVLALAWFAYDGFHTYPANNDYLVARLKDFLRDNKTVTLPPNDAQLLDSWKGWTSETPANREHMDEIIKEDKSNVHLEGWKEVVDVAVQRWIVCGLAVAAIASLAWFFKCQRRRAIAEETTVSPGPGVVIPWENIKIVDNTRWKSMGIVDITYTDDQRRERHADFDDYKLEAKPLLAILDQLAEKAVNAEFLPKEAIPSPAKNAPPSTESPEKSEPA